MSFVSLRELSQTVNTPEILLISAVDVLGRGEKKGGEGRRGEVRGGRGVWWRLRAG